MPREKIPVTLYGPKADRFEEIQSELEDDLGYEPTRPEVIGQLMAEWD